MTKPALALLSGLLAWAVWFSLAYGLHGAQCSGTIPLSRSGGQMAQIALWLGTLGATTLLARIALTWATADTLGRLRMTARYLQLTGLVATAFVGLPLLVLQPC